MGNKAKLILRRAAGFQGAFSSFKVFIDDEKLGTIGVNESHEYWVDPGKHIIRCEDRSGGNNGGFEVNVEKGETVFLLVRPGVRFTLILMILFVVVGYFFGIHYSYNNRPGYITYGFYTLLAILVLHELYYEIIAKDKSLVVDRDPKALSEEKPAV